MSALRRPALALMGASFVLAGVVACAGTVTGEATYAGAGQTTPPTTTQTTTTQTTTTQPTTTTPTTTAAPTTPGPTPQELTACLNIPLTDIDAFGAFNDLADMPESAQTPEARGAVAMMFDLAQREVKGYVDSLPPGEIKQASVGYRQSQIEVRDRLRAGTAVNTDIILEAQDVLEAACGTA